LVGYPSSFYRGRVQHPVKHHLESLQWITGLSNVLQLRRQA